MHHEVECQTPKLFPGEEVVLSQRAELGMQAYKQLNEGGSVDDRLMVAMFMQFIKEQANINGWVLINYPTNMEQASILEESLTAVPFPKVETEGSTCDIDDLLDLEHRTVEEEDKDKELRHSRILPDPQPVVEDPDYYTYLTAFINVKFDDDKDKIKNPEALLRLFLT